MKLLSRVRLLVTPWTAAHQAPPSMGFSRQEYCSGVPLPSPKYRYAAAKSLQSCPTLCDPIDGSPPGSVVPGILQARTLEWVAIAFSPGGASGRQPACQCRKRETWVQSVAWENPMQEGMRTHSCILPGKSQGERSLMDYSPWAYRVGHNRSNLAHRHHTHSSLPDAF